jgi:hypothetical protein
MTFDQGGGLAIAEAITGTQGSPAPACRSLDEVFLAFPRH